MIYTKDVVKVYTELNNLNPEVQVLIERLDGFDQELYGIFIYMVDAVEKISKISATDDMEVHYLDRLILNGGIRGVDFRGLPQRLHVPRELHTLRLSLEVMHRGANAKHRSETTQHYFMSLSNIALPYAAGKNLQDRSKWTYDLSFDPESHGLDVNYPVLDNIAEASYMRNRTLHFTGRYIHELLLFKQPYTTWMKGLATNTNRRLEEKIDTLNDESVQLIDHHMPIEVIYDLLEFLVARNRPPSAKPAKYLRMLLDYIFGIGSIYKPSLAEAKEIETSNTMEAPEPMPAEVKPATIRSEKTRKAQDAAKEIIKLLDKKEKMLVALDNIESRLAECEEVIVNERTLISEPQGPHEKNATWIGKNVFFLPNGHGITADKVNLALFEMGFHYPLSGAWVPYDSFNSPLYCRLMTRGMRRTTGVDQLQEWHVWTMEAIALMRFEWNKIRGSIDFQEVELKKRNFRKPNSPENE